MMQPLEAEEIIKMQECEAGVGLLSPLLNRIEAEAPAMNMVRRLRYIDGRLFSLDD